MPLNDDDFEVIEETINDFDYFYDEDEEQKRNRKIIVKYRLISVAIALFIVIFLITVLGISRMKIYGTNNVLTHDEITYLELKRTCDEVMDKAQSFYAYDSSTGTYDMTCAYAEIQNALANLTVASNKDSFASEKKFVGLTLTEWQKTFEGYIEATDVETVKFPKKADYEDYVFALNAFVSYEYEMITYLLDENKYDAIVAGDVVMAPMEDNANMYYVELASQYVLLQEQE